MGGRGLGAGRRPAAAIRLAAVGLGLSRPLRRILAPARRAELGRHGRGDRVPAFVEAVLPARWENVRARDFDGAASNQVRDN